MAQVAEASRRAVRCPVCLTRYDTSEPEDSSRKAYCSKCKRNFLVRDALPFEPQAEPAQELPSASVGAIGCGVASLIVLAPI